MIDYRLTSARITVATPRGVSRLEARPMAVALAESPATESGPMTEFGLPQLIDSYGREIRNLRISVTDRCNFRCVYCMPAEGLPWLPKPSLLTFEEIEQLSRLMVQMGIREIRLTGGEPLVRKNLPELIRRLNPLKEIGLRHLSITTNGLLLKAMAKDLVEAGLTRINVSLDSLDRDTFKRLTRRDALQGVLDGLAAVEQYPQLKKIKVNAVAIRGVTESEIVAFCELARRKPYQVRFIEFMPLDADQIWNPKEILTGRELVDLISATYMPLLPTGEDEPSATARTYRFADGVGELGFINPVSEPFCRTCDRIRLTADGQLRTCLFSLWETDLREPLRAGASDHELADVLLGAVKKKEMKHYINDTRFVRTKRNMSQIGG